MKLKKLELSGFKSFPQKAGIEFPDGISAIVGPNGCGKSNIIDAIRWVMGEQNARNLRGKAMDDVIFSGANGNAPLNMAEVSMILSNDNGNAPEELKDFTELMLTRRLYRSGENAYFLNKQPCRLKDIHNIFMGSGMGARSYSIIEQGNIGAITDAGPEERRFFIEEAAGVTRYKSRKKETLRKIEATQQNLLRLDDILSEIKRQMGRLNRQAKNAQRYREYQQRIERLEIAMALCRYDRNFQEHGRIQALLQSLKDSDLQNASRMGSLDAAVETLKLQRAQKNEEISSAKALLFEARRQADRSESELSHLRGEAERLATELERLQTSHGALNEKNQNLEFEIDQTRGQFAEMQQEHTGVQEALTRENAASQDLRSRLETLNRKVDAARKNLADLSSQEARCRNIHQNAAANRQSLQRRLKKIDEETVLAERKVADLTLQEKEAQNGIQTVQQSLAAAGERIAAQQEQATRGREALALQVRHVQELDLERNRLRSRHSALKKMDDNLEWYKDGVKTLIKAFRAQTAADGGTDSDRPAGILALTADVLDAAPSFEIAVEAVLGDALQYLIVEDQQAGLNAVAFLDEHKGGRCGFIPISGLRPRSSAGADRLIDHVSVKPGFESAAEALLGHALVAPDLKGALGIFQRNGHGCAVVTPQGDMITHQGLISGGSPDQGSGILAKKQELRSLEHRITRVDEKLKEQRRILSDLESGAREFETRLQKLGEEKNNLARAEMEAEKSHFKAIESLKHARRHLEVTLLEQEQLMGEESDIDEEIRRRQIALKNLEDQAKSAQSEASQAARAAQDAAARMDVFNRKTVDLKLRQTALEARIENTGATLRRLVDFQYEANNRLNQTVADIEGKKQKIVEVDTRIRDLESAVSGLYENLTRLQEDLQNRESEYRGIDEDLKNHDQIIGELKSERDKTLQKIHLLESQNAQLEIKQEHLIGILKDRYQQSVDQARAVSGGLELSEDQIQAELAECRRRMESLGEVNLAAIGEYAELKNRFEFLDAQRNDLIRAIADLHRVIREINRISQERFTRTFDLINEKLAEVFPKLFNGGVARLELADAGDPLEAGVEFMIHPPGKKLTRLSLLSGGEKALSAIAFIFAIFLIKPASFCLLDEIDAPLDDANVARFNEMLKSIGNQSQIIMITHNKKSMEYADRLFGITMEKKGVSKVVSVDLNR